MKSNIGKHLEYLDLLTNTYIGEEEKLQLTDKIEIVKTRLEPSVLNIAVIGEFSSGKSTLINSFLRENILKTASKATTSSVIFVEKTDADMSLEVQFELTKIKASENNYSLLEEEVKKYSDKDIGSIYDLLHILTSEQQIAGTVKDIHLKVDKTSIPSGIRVIDTPGINPHGELTLQHKNITKDVLKRVADLAFIVIPANQPMSKTLETFILENLQRFLHRCIFIVTGIDNETENTKDEIESYIKNKLTSNLKISNSILFSVSAITMLPVKKIPSSKKDTWNYWQEQFRSFEKSLWTLLTEKKDVIISEHHYFKLMPIIKNLQKLLKEHKDVLISTRQNVIEEKKVDVENLKRLTDFLDNSANQGKLKIDKNIKLVRQEIKDSLTEYRYRSIHEKMYEIINNGGNLYSFKEDESQQITKEVYNDAEAYVTEMDNFYEHTLQKATHKIIDKFNNEFQQYFPKFTFLDQSIDIKTIEASYPDLLFTSSEKFLKNEKIKRIRNGAILGAIFGKLLIGSENDTTNIIIGIILGIAFVFGLNHIKEEGNIKVRNSIVGGITGKIICSIVGASEYFFTGVFTGAIFGLISAYLAGDPKNNQISVKIEIQQNITDFYDELKQRLKKKVNNQKELIYGEVDKFFSNCLLKYGSQLEEKIAVKDEQIKAMEHQIAIVDQELLKLENMEVEVNTEQEKLKLL